MIPPHILGTPPSITLYYFIISCIVAESQSTQTATILTLRYNPYDNCYPLSLFLLPHSSFPSFHFSYHLTQSQKNDKLYPEEFDGLGLGEEDDNDGDDDDAGLPFPVAGSGSSSGNGSSSSGAASSSTSGKESNRIRISKPAASYEEILYQVFVQDKRQFQRMHNPLPRTVDGSLPPLETNTARSSSSGASSQGSRGVGWRAPPKPQEKKDIRQPTQTQLDAAKRLSQGLSVSQTSTSSVYERQTGGGYLAG